VTTTDNVVEDESNHTPNNVVGWRSGRNQTSRTEDEWPVDVANPRVVELELHETCDSGSKCAGQEEEAKTVVHLTLRELTSRSDDTPDDGRRTKHSGRRANETIGLVSVAHAVNVGEHPSLNTKLDSSSNDCSDDLTPEHRTRAERETGENQHACSMSERR
jgi:hypothetical protein